MHFKDVAAAAKFGGDVGRKHLRVAAGHVDVDVRAPNQAVENIMERDEEVIALVRRDILRIDVRIPDLAAELDFVQKNRVAF